MLKSRGAGPLQTQTYWCWPIPMVRDSYTSRCIPGAGQSTRLLHHLYRTSTHHSSATFKPFKRVTPIPKTIVADREITNGLGPLFLIYCTSRKQKSGSKLHAQAIRKPALAAPLSYGESGWQLEMTKPNCPWDPSRRLNPLGDLLPQPWWYDPATT